MSSGDVLAPSHAEAPSLSEFNRELRAARTARPKRTCHHVSAMLARVSVTQEDRGVKDALTVPGLSPTRNYHAA